MKICLRILLLGYNTITKSDSERKGLFEVSHHSPALMQRLQRSTYWLAPHDLFSLFCYSIQDTSIGMASPTVSWTHLHQSSIGKKKKKLYHRVAYRRSRVGHFFKCNPVFQNHVGLCKVDIKL